MLCTLISEISDFIRNVPAREMSESGVHGGKLVEKYLIRQEGTNYRQSNDSDETPGSINSLIELLSALQNCDFETGYREEENWTDVKYVFVVVVDRIERFSGSSNADYLGAFKEALNQTVVTKMGGYILFVDDPADEI
ncbi:hypothetical protein CIB48_g4423 [Xylaria polymorpha]|nr:hypothetical protein CIB48_g4423 [Xylaria polymorpha]